MTENLINCPTCKGFLAYFHSFHLANGEEVPADLRCIHCGRSVIYTIHESIEFIEEKNGSGFSIEKEDLKKNCLFCGVEFIDRSSAHNKKFCKSSHRVNYWNKKAHQLLKSKKEVEEMKKIGRIKWKIRHQNEVTNGQSR